METEPGYDAAVWSQMADQLGLQGLIIPEEFGGSGYSYVELIVVLEEMGRAPAVRPVLLDGRARRQHADPLRRRRRQEGPAPGHRVGRDHRHPRLHRGERSLGRGGHHRHGRGRRRRLHDHRHQDLRARRPHREPDPRRGPHRQGRCRCSRSTPTLRASPARRCRRWTRPASRPSSSFDDMPATLDRHRGRGLGRARPGARPRRRGPRGRAGRRRAGVPRDGGPVRQGPRAVRPPDRLVPGHQAQVRRHAARGRVGQVGRLLRRLVRRRS